MRTVIIGGGNAGLQVADTLRRKGFEGSITMLCEEAHLPYQRPPLSKKYLEGELAEPRLFLRPEKYYADKDIDLQLSTKATHIDRDEKTVLTAAGDKVPYDKLVFAIGARVRPLPGTEGRDDLHYIRTIDDIERLKAAIADNEKILLVGGGFIGLEAAATLAKLGKTVTVVEAMSTIMPGLVAPELAAFFREQHESHGVTIVEGVGVSNIVRHEQGGATAMLSDGRTIDADLCIIGIGVIPNSGLAEAAGIECDRGILVDEFAQTSAPDIYAVGDCANGMHQRFGAHTRLESVQNAVDQATVAALAILGSPEPHAALPWFWSDQYDLKLQMAGLSRGYDQMVVRGDMAEKKFSICYFKDGALIAVDSVNSIPDHMAAKRLLAGDVAVTPEQCADADVPLKHWLG